MAKINVKNTEINVITINNEDYLSLTDMLKAKDGDFLIKDWLRNRNTLEFIGIWEKIYNPVFNYGEFALIKNQSGLNSFSISVKEFCENKLSYSYRRNKRKFDSIRTYCKSKIHCLCRRGRCPKRCAIRKNCKRLA